MRTARVWMIAFVGLIGCSVVSAQAPKAKIGDVEREPAVDRFISRFLASRPLAVVREAERIEALPVETIGTGLSSTFKVMERPVALDPATMREVRDRVVRTRSYLGGGTACMFQPGLALRFHKNRDSVQMLVCFLCHELRFEEGSGRAIGDKMLFDENVMHLLAVARKTFPDRPEFRVLP
jgi:hypothetical protein